MKKKDEQTAAPTPNLPPVENNLPAKVENNLPAMSAADVKQMYGDLGTEDITVPRLTVLQGLSPEVADGLGRPGELFIKGLNQCHGKELEFVPLIRSKTRIRWTPLQEGGGIRCQSFDGKQGQGDPGVECGTCDLAIWKGTTPPVCDQYENVIIMIRGAEDPIPMALSGARTKLKALRDLNTLFMTQQLKQRPLYMKSYILMVIEKTNKANLKYYSFKIKPGNNNAVLPADEIAQYEAIYNSIKGKNLVVEQEQKEQVADNNPEL